MQACIGVGAGRRACCCCVLRAHEPGAAIMRDWWESVPLQRATGRTSKKSTELQFLRSATCRFDCEGGVVAAGDYSRGVLRQ